MEKESKSKSKLESLGELNERLKDKTVIIPLLQRNYKWDVNDINTNQSLAENVSLSDYYEFLDNGENRKKSRASIENLFNDILHAFEDNQKEYTIGMATLYEDGGNESVQILDGQQRMISLGIIVKALGKTSIFNRLTFERDGDEDKDKERENFLKNDTPIEEIQSVDVLHMKTAYEFLINDCLKDEEGAWGKDKKDKYFNWMMEQVKIICRYTENEPLQEFLSLNEKKTPFSSTDYDRAYQLKYWSKQEITQEITQEMILKEHAEIQRYLYTNEKLYDLVKFRYPEFQNHMDVIFQKVIVTYADDLQKCCERKDEIADIQQKGYSDAFNYLKLCHIVLRSIYQEIQEQGKSKLNVNVYNAVMTLYQIDKEFRFFDLVDINDDKTFEVRLKERFDLLGTTYQYMKEKYQNEFLQSQLYGEILTNDEYNNSCDRITNNSYKEIEQYISPDICKIVSDKIGVTEALIEKGKSYSQLINGGRKSFFDILNLNEIKQIIIPAIQRDYTLGSNKDYLLDLLFDLSKDFLKNTVQYTPEKYTKGRAELVVYNSLTEGVMWSIPEIKYYTYYNENDLTPYFELCKRAGYNRRSEFYKNSRDRSGKERLVNTAKDLSEHLDLGDKLLKIKDTSFFENVVYNKLFIFSIIFGYLEETGNFYLYDGQQRVVTIVYLCAYLLNKKMNKDKSFDNKKYETYRDILRKFRFEKRETANEILYLLLNESNVDLRRLKGYIIDHTTYSIYKLLETYELYTNDYGKKIIAINVDYLMNCISFEFAVIQESSIADQLYMDLNSKNEPLTKYENYKAELVYLLSSRVNNEYQENWKLQLDNEYLNKCYKSNSNEWNKELANKAEEKEMLVVHWCFKMACMEYGIKIDNIDSKSRLAWIDSNESVNDIVAIVGNVVRYKIFGDDEQNYVNQIYCNHTEDKLIKYNECFRVLKPQFSIDEFKLWMDLRFAIRDYDYDYAFTQVGDKSIRIHNLTLEEIKNLAEYIVILCHEKRKVSSDDEVIKYLINKYHCIFENGYLETDTLDTLSMFWEEKDGQQKKNTDKIEKALNYFSEFYLSDKLFDVSDESEQKIDNWIEYIYSVKLCERINNKLYDQVQVWEDNELKNRKSYDSDIKKIAKKYFDGNLYLYLQYTKMLESDKVIKCEVANNMDTIPNLPQLVLGNMKDTQLRTNIVEKTINKESIQYDVKIDFEENKKVYREILDYMKNDKQSELTKKFIRSVIETYYYNCSNNKVDLWKWSDESNQFCKLQENDKVYIGKFEVLVSDIQSFNEQFTKNNNTESNLIKYFWTTYVGDNKETLLKENLKNKRYDFVVGVLKFDEENLKNKWLEWYGNPSI